MASMEVLPSPGAASPPRSPNADMNGEDTDLFQRIAQELMELSPGTIRRDLGMSWMAPNSSLSPRTPDAIIRRLVVDDSDIQVPSMNMDHSEPEEGLPEVHSTEIHSTDCNTTPTGSRRCTSEDVCAICLDPIETIDNRRPLVVRTNCKHEFHLTCLKRNREFSDSCPMCRHRLARGLTPVRLPSPGDDTHEENSATADEEQEEVVPSETSNAVNDENRLETPTELRALAVVLQDIEAGNYVDF